VVEAIAAVQVSIGGVSADVLNARLSATVPGLYVSVRVPQGTPGSDGVPVILSAAGQDSNRVTISVDNSNAAMQP
jgi:uncharacterized protein (TIGR03437 family)